MSKNELSGFDMPKSHKWLACYEREVRAKTLLGHFFRTRALVSRATDGSLRMEIREDGGITRPIRSNPRERRSIVLRECNLERLRDTGLEWGLKAEFRSHLLVTVIFEVLDLAAEALLDLSDEE